MNMAERIAKVRYYGILVSDDGFYPTPTGPVHIDDLELGRVLLAHDDLLAACEYVGCIGGHTCCEETPCRVCAAINKATHNA